MADPTTDPGDPLGGWQPGSGAPVAVPAVSPDDPLQAAQKKSVLDTSYHTVPSDTRQGKTATADEGYGLMVPATGPSIDALKAGDVATALAPAPGRVYGDVLPWAADAGTGANGNWSLPNFIRGPLQALAGGPSNAVMVKTGPDGGYALSPEAQSIVPFFAGPLRVGGGPTTTLTADAAANATARARELGQPPAATLSDVLRQQRGPANMPPSPMEMPPPPVPFTTTPGPTSAPSGGLLGPTPTGGPLPGPRAAPQGGLLGPAATMTADEIRARAEGYYSTADKAAAQGAMLPQDNANAVRSAVTDIMPDDPEKARYFAKTNPTVAAAAKDVSDFSGQPMSYDSAMQLDRSLTSDIRATKDPNEQRLLGQMQDGVRAQMDQLPDLDNLRAGRQAYTQYIKQSQMEDINYNASLKNDPAQVDASVRQQAAAMLKNDSKMRNWTDDERAQLEQVAKSGNIGMLGRLSVGLVKPVARALGGAAGGWVAGPVGGIVGSEIGGDIGATQAAKLRAYLSQTTLDPVMAQISRGVPPIPTPPRGP